MSTDGLRAILLGAPGSGKGTQAERLATALGVPAISTGEMLRQAVAEGSDLGARVESVMAAGALVDRWWPARRLARLAEAEVAEELSNLAAETPGPRPTSRQALAGWAILAVGAVVLTWTGFAHLQILRFNLFLVLTLGLAFVTAACFPKAAPARAS